MDDAGGTSGGFPTPAPANSSGGVGMMCQLVDYAGSADAGGGGEELAAKMDSTVQEVPSATAPAVTVMLQQQQ